MPTRRRRISSRASRRVIVLGSGSGRGSSFSKQQQGNTTRRTPAAAAAAAVDDNDNGNDNNDNDNDDNGDGAAGDTTALDITAVDATAADVGGDNYEYPTTSTSNMNPNASSSASVVSASSTVTSVTSNVSAFGTPSDYVHSFSNMTRAAESFASAMAEEEPLFEEFEEEEDEAFEDQYLNYDEEEEDTGNVTDESLSECMGETFEASDSLEEQLPEPHDNSESADEVRRQRKQPLHDFQEKQGSGTKSDEETASGALATTTTMSSTTALMPPTRKPDDEEEVQYTSACEDDQPKPPNRSIETTSNSIQSNSSSSEEDEEEEEEDAVEKVLYQSAFDDEPPKPPSRGPIETTQNNNTSGHSISTSTSPSNQSSSEQEEVEELQYKSAFDDEPPKPPSRLPMETQNNIKSGHSLSTSSSRVIQSSSDMLPYSDDEQQQEQLLEETACVALHSRSSTSSSNVASYVVDIDEEGSNTNMNTNASSRASVVSVSSTVTNVTSNVSAFGTPSDYVHSFSYMARAAESFATAMAEEEPMFEEFEEEDDEAFEDQYLKYYEEEEDTGNETDESLSECMGETFEASDSLEDRLQVTHDNSESVDEVRRKRKHSLHDFQEKQGSGTKSDEETTSGALATTTTMGSTTALMPPTRKPDDEEEVQYKDAFDDQPKPPNRSIETTSNSIQSNSSSSEEDGDGDAVEKVLYQSAFDDEPPKPPSRRPMETTQNYNTSGHSVSTSSSPSKQSSSDLLLYSEDEEQQEQPPEVAARVVLHSRSSASSSDVAMYVDDDEEPAGRMGEEPAISNPFQHSISNDTETAGSSCLHDDYENDTDEQDEQEQPPTLEEAARFRPSQHSTSNTSTTGSSHLRGDDDDDEEGGDTEQQQSPNIKGTTRLQSQHSMSNTSTSSSYLLHEADTDEDEDEDEVDPNQQQQPVPDQSSHPSHHPRSTTTIETTETSITNANIVTSPSSHQPLDEFADEENEEVPLENRDHRQTPNNNKPLLDRHTDHSDYSLSSSEECDTIASSPVRHPSSRPNCRQSNKRVQSHTAHSTPNEDRGDGTSASRSSSLALLPTIVKSALKDIQEVDDRVTQLERALSILQSSHKKLQQEQSSFIEDRAELLGLFTKQQQTIEKLESRLQEALAFQAVQTIAPSQTTTLAEVEDLKRKIEHMKHDNAGSAGELQGFGAYSSSDVDECFQHADNIKNLPILPATKIRRATSDEADGSVDDEKGNISDLTGATKTAPKEGTAHEAVKKEIVAEALNSCPDSDLSRVSVLDSFPDLNACRAVGNSKSSDLGRVSAIFADESDASELTDDLRAVKQRIKRSRVALRPNVPELGRHSSHRSLHNSVAGSDVMTIKQGSEEQSVSNDEESVPSPKRMPVSQERPSNATEKSFGSFRMSDHSSQRQQSASSLASRSFHSNNTKGFRTSRSVDSSVYKSPSISGRRSLSRQSFESPGTKRRTLDRNSPALMSPATHNTGRSLSDATPNTQATGMAEDLTLRWSSWQGSGEFGNSSYSTAQASFVCTAVEKKRSSGWDKTTTNMVDVDDGYLDNASAIEMGDDLSQLNRDMKEKTSSSSKWGLRKLAKKVKSRLSFRGGKNGE